MRFGSSLILAAMALPLAAGCSGCSGSSGSSGSGADNGNGGDSERIKIHSSLPRTGSAKGQTDTIVNGIKLALEEAGNKAGKFTIDYTDADDATAIDGKWTSERETAIAEQAVKDPDVMVYIGPYNSGAAAVSMPILNKAGLLMISPACTWPGLTKPGKGDSGEPEKHRPTGKINFTRVVPADDLQGPLGADWAKSMGVKKVYILHDNEVYGKGIAELFRDRCKELKIPVLGFDAVDYKQADFRTKMGDVKAAGPDLVYFGGTSQSGAPQIVKDMVNVGLDKQGCKLMVPDGCFEDAFVQGAGKENFGKLECFVTFGGMPANQLTGKGKTFYEHYKKKYGIEPEAYAVYGYESAKVALTAIEKAAKKDRAAILAAALAIRDFDGALGKWSFDENGDTSLMTMSGSKIDAEGRPNFVKRLGE
jgi:branched-chain amino acid transport system substrate-binding protein